MLITKEKILEKMNLVARPEEAAKLFIVSKVEFSDKNEIEVHHIDAQKCPRCWNYVDELVKVDEETSVCKRCYKVVKGE